MHLVFTQHFSFTDSFVFVISPRSLFSTFNDLFQYMNSKICPFIEIPALRSPPKAKSRGLNSVTLRWTKWERFKDAGEGPVTGYRVFYKHQNMTGNWRKKRVTTHEVVIDSLMENEVYVFKVAPIHRDGFEGYPGPEAIIRTCGSEFR